MTSEPTTDVIMEGVNKARTAGCDIVIGIGGGSVIDSGKAFTGIRVSQDEKEIVLRNLAEPKPITIKTDEIDEIQESKTSLMPANLVRMLKNRQDFDDLMKYILEVRKH